MVYRAKCTKIVSVVETYYANPRYVRDQKDRYVEVETEEEAELIEELNRTETKRLELIMKIDSLTEYRDK